MIINIAKIGGHRAMPWKTSKMKITLKYKWPQKWCLLWKQTKHQKWRNGFHRDIKANFHFTDTFVANRPWAYQKQWSVTCLSDGMAWQGQLYLLCQLQFLIESLINAKLKIKVQCLFLVYYSVSKIMVIDPDHDCQNKWLELNDKNTDLYNSRPRTTNLVASCPDYRINNSL